MEEEKKCCGGMPHMGMGCHGHCKHHLIKMILKILIVVMIFWCGFNLGKIVGTIRGEYGRGFEKGNFEMMRGDKNVAPLTENVAPVAPTVKQ